MDNPQEIRFKCFIFQISLNFINITLRITIKISMFVYLVSDIQFISICILNN